MRIETCKGCKYLNGLRCERLLKGVARIRGCSLNAASRRFYQPRSGAEAYRLNVLKPKPEEPAK